MHLTTHNTKKNCANPKEYIILIIVLAHTSHYIVATGHTHPSTGRPIIGDPSSSTLAWASTTYMYNMIVLIEEMAELTLFLMSMLAWDSRSCFTTSEWPPSTASWSGVSPSCEKSVVTSLLIYYSTLTTATLIYSSSGYSFNISPLYDMYIQ
jgi:hypothetical protein